ncbi:AAA family ATPase [Methylovulum psychrotolerans]|uniref:Cobyrinic acid a,c-diamide synthase n=1 Tax=Methylovulum psychrotolerans TaxID=1704499 RepID=A0A2S5CFV0_9GAMM|nr:AAA family ATPase [Methylovulum psychrotolerans]POZ49683.1 cobyrinic acid a,c-diamide synthase [Methylovulum psychrotolerans]
MKILAIIGQKGGSGKTTTALGLAVEAIRRGKAVAVVDLDPQATAASWSDRREDKEAPAVISCQAARLRQVLDAAKAQGVNLAIIDTAGKSNEAAISAAKVANWVLMPIQPQIFDIETLQSVKEILTLAGNPTASVVINRAAVQGKRHEETQEAAEAMGFNVAPVVMFQRTAHGDAGNIGLTAAEYEPKGKAAQEMAALYDYITTL